MKVVRRSWQEYDKPPSVEGDIIMINTFPSSKVVLEDNDLVVCNWIDTDRNLPWFFFRDNERVEWGDLTDNEQLRARIGISSNGYISICSGLRYRDESNYEIEDAMVALLDM